MDNQKVELFLISRYRYFETFELRQKKEKLENLSEARINTLQWMEFKDPLVAFALSLTLGTFGVDRFYVGDIGLGVLKLITMGGCGVWTIIDWFLIMDRAKEKNMEELQRVLAQ